MPTASLYKCLDMTLNSIWWWGSSFWALGNVKYLFIVITPRFTLTRVVIFVRVLSMAQIKPIQPATWSSSLSRSITGFEFSFLSPRLVAIPRLNIPVCPRLREKNWIHTFLKSIRTMYNINSLIMDLNLSNWLHFLW